MSEQQITWQPVGKELIAGHHGDGHPTLEIHIKGSAPMQAAIHAHAQALTDRVRADVLASVEASTEFTRLIGVRPQWRQATQAFQQADSRLRELRERKQSLEATLPVPAGLPGKLAALVRDIAQAEQTQKEREQELAAINGIYDTACAALVAMLKSLVEPARLAFVQAESRAFSSKLAELAQRESETLTELCILRRAPHGVKTPDAIALAKAIIDSPDAEQGTGG